MPPERQDLNQSREIPEKLREVSLLRRIELEMLSKAALRSKWMRMDRKPKSVAGTISFSHNLPTAHVMTQDKNHLNNGLNEGNIVTAVLTRI